MVSDAVTGLDAGQVLDAVESWHTEQLEREVGIFLAAAHFADLHHPSGRPDRGGPVLPAMEKPKRLGGAGTPLVWEFAVAELGARIGKSPRGGQALVADALDVRHRLPRLWQRVRAGEVRVCYARQVAQQTRELSAEAARLVDAAVATYADGRLTWGRFQTLLAAKITEADPEAAAARERAAAEERFAKVGRSNEHGQKTLYVKSAAAAIIRINATIDYYARALGVLGDTDSLDHRRAKAVLIMANPLQALQMLQAFAAHRTRTGAPDVWPDQADRPAGDALDATGGDGTTHDDTATDAGAGAGAAGGADPAAPFTRPFHPAGVRPDSRFACGFDPRALLPRVTVYLHLYARADTGELGPVARWEGEGPVTSAYVRDLLGPHASFTVAPVLDLARMVPVDGYEVPDGHREAVHLRTPADVFPFAANTSRTQQMDHTRSYLSPDDGGPPGQTGLHNLGPMVGFHHRIKTHGPWLVRQPFPGIYLWRDPHGRHYLVDHTGTRRLATHPATGPPEPAAPRSTRAEPSTAELTVEIYPDPGLDIYYEPAHAA